MFWIFNSILDASNTRVLITTCNLQVIQYTLFAMSKFFNFLFKSILKVFLTQITFDSSSYSLSVCMYVNEVTQVSVLTGSARKLGQSTWVCQLQVMVKHSQNQFFLLPRQTAKLSTKPSSFGKSLHIYSKKQQDKLYL